MEANLIRLCDTISMPTINGTIYPESKPILHNFNELNILILGELGDDVEQFVASLEVLKRYLIDAGRPDISIKLHCTSTATDTVANRLNITKHSINPVTQEQLIEAVISLDIDIVFDQDVQFDQKFLWSKFYEFDAVKSINKLRRSVEDYLVGSGIAWTFESPIWNMPLFMKYMAVPGICMDFFTFMGECVENRGYTDDQKEKVRYITNKIKQVEYARDILHYHIKRMRKARRNGMSDDDYNIQLNYHLSNFYFLLAGTLDSLARLINDVYRLKLTKYSDLGVEKKGFINANRKKRTGFVSVFNLKKPKKWISFLKERRNFIAHDGDMRQTPIVKEKKKKLTDEEVNNIVDRQVDWVLLARILPSEIYQAQRDQAVELTRIKNNYEVIAEKIMMVPKKGGIKMHSPLIDIDHDYEQFVEILSKALDRLKK